MYKNEVIQNIYERRSVRKYKDLPVEKELIEEILAAAKMAPSAINSQSWKFYILTDKDKIELLSNEIVAFAEGELSHTHLADKDKIAGFLHVTHPGEERKLQINVFHGAPVVLFITAPRNDEWRGLNVGMCAQNLMLAAKSLGLETCTVGFGKLVMMVKDYPLLHIPADEEVEIALIVGYGDEQPQTHPRKEGNVIYV